MGIKDQRWQEAPGYCVECGNLRPLNRSAVCRRCHEAAPIGTVRDWEEDEHCSQWYYGGLQEQPSSFIILGDYRGIPGWLREDFKVLGIFEGQSPEHAVSKFLAELPAEDMRVIEPIVSVARITEERWEFDLAELAPAMQLDDEA